MSSFVWSQDRQYSEFLRAGPQPTVLEVHTATILDAQENLRAELLKDHARLAEVVGAGVYAVTEQIGELRAEIADIHTTFLWGFSEILDSLGSLRATLTELKAIAKTPEQTWAYEQYEIAREAARRGLYPEALKHLDHAISGFGGRTGYAIEHRFHFLQARILIGSYQNWHEEILEPAKAEDSFLMAARFAGTEHRGAAALASLGAGWAAYVQGAMDRAASHTAEAIRYEPAFPEALFQLGKIQMHLGRVDRGVESLRSAIGIDRSLALKAALDGDYMEYSASVDDMLRSEMSDRNSEAEKLAGSLAEMIQIIRALVVGRGGRFRLDVRHGGSLEDLVRVQGEVEGLMSQRTLFASLDAIVAAEAALSEARELGWAFLHESVSVVKSKMSGVRRVAESKWGWEGDGLSGMVGGGLGASQGCALGCVVSLVLWIVAALLVTNVPARHEDLAITLLTIVLFGGPLGGILFSAVRAGAIRANARTELNALRHEHAEIEETMGEWTGGLG